MHIVICCRSSAWLVRARMPWRALKEREKEAHLAKVYEHIGHWV